MHYHGTLIAVHDMEVSRRFYTELFGLQVENDFGSNIALTGGIFLQTLDSWSKFISVPASDIAFAHNSAELYFEADDMDAFLGKLDAFSVQLVHPLLEHRWGQRGIRFYDPDGHMIEVSENITSVIRRFATQGMNTEQIAQRMDVSPEYIVSHLQDAE